MNAPGRRSASLSTSRSWTGSRRRRRSSRPGTMICASIHRLAPFEPSGIVCLTGPGEEQRDAVVEGLRTIGDEAARAGVRIGLEPMNRIGGEDWTIISSLTEAVELLEDADRPALGIQFDTWNLWNTPTVLDDIAAHCDRFVGVHVSDWREPTRGWCDRVLPGDGIADLPAILGALERATPLVCRQLADRALPQGPPGRHGVAVAQQRQGAVRRLAQRRPGSRGVRAQQARPQAPRLGHARAARAHGDGPRCAGGAGCRAR